MSLKLSELAEKITQLDQNDLLLVTTNGESKSVKVSTLEAPLKSYADTKASEAQSAAIATAYAALQSAINSEVARATGIESGLQAQITQEISDRSSETAEFLKTDGSRSMEADLSLNSYDENGKTVFKTGSVVANSAGQYSINLNSQFLNGVHTLDLFLNDVLVFSVGLNGGSKPSGSPVIDTTFTFATTNFTFNTTQSGTYVLKKYTPGGYVDHKITGLANGTNPTDAVNLSQLTAIMPIGAMFLYSGTTAPTGWLLCDGSAVSRSTYSSLFGVVGSSFGSGNGSTTFNLPNPDANANLRYIIKF